MTKLKQAVKFAHLHWKKKLYPHLVDSWLVDIIHLNMFLSHEKPLYVTSPCTQLHIHTHKNTLNALVRISVCLPLTERVISKIDAQKNLAVIRLPKHTPLYTHAQTQQTIIIPLELVFFVFVFFEATNGLIGSGTDIVLGHLTITDALIEPKHTPLFCCTTD